MCQLLKLSDKGEESTLLIEKGFLRHAMQRVAPLSVYFN